MTTTALRDRVGSPTYKAPQSAILPCRFVSTVHEVQPQSWRIQPIKIDGVDQSVTRTPALQHRRARLDLYYDRHRRADHTAALKEHESNLERQIADRLYIG